MFFSQPATRATSVGLNRPPSAAEPASELPVPESDPAPESLDPEEVAPELVPELLAPDPELAPEEPLDPEAAPELAPELPPPELLGADPDPEPDAELDDVLCAVPLPEEEEHPPTTRASEEHTVR